MTATYITAAALVTLAICMWRGIRRAEREIDMEHEQNADGSISATPAGLVPRCEGRDCPNHGEAAEIVRRELAAMGVGVGT